MKPIVLGAAGFLGINLVDALIARGIEPRCGRRRRTNVLALRKRKVPMVNTDQDDVDGMVEAMQGMDTVFHCAAHYPRLSIHPEQTLELGTRQLQNTLDAAARAGIQRFVYVSTTAIVAPNPDGGPSNETHRHPARPGHGTYHDLKWELERMIDAEDRFQTVSAAPGACIGPWDLRVGTTALLVATANGMNPPHPNGWINPVDARDVGEALARIGLREAPSDRYVFAGGNHRLHDMLVGLADRYRVAAPVPALSDDEAVRLADELEHKAHETGERALLAREIADMVIHGVPIDTTRAQTELGMSWRSLDETLDAYDAWARPLRILPTIEP